MPHRSRLQQERPTGYGRSATTEQRWAWQLVQRVELSREHAIQRWMATGDRESADERGRNRQWLLRFQPFARGNPSRRQDGRELGPLAEWEVRRPRREGALDPLGESRRSALVHLPSARINRASGPARDMDTAPREIPRTAAISR